jgi:hypothetical protein
MPIARFQMPDGRIARFEIPEGLSPEQAEALIQAEIPNLPSAPKQSSFFGELKRGVEQPLSSIRTAFGSLTSPEEAATAGVERSQKINEAAGEGPSLEAVKRAYADNGLLSAAGEVASQIPKAIAGQGGTFATAAGGARLGAAAGRPLGRMGSVVGGGLGAAAALMPQMFGSMQERQAAEQQERGEPVSIDQSKAAISAVGQAGLESAGQALILGKGLVKGILGITDDAALMTAKAQAKLVQEAERSLAAATGRGVARGATEMPIEVGQAILERWQAGLPLTGDDAYKEYAENAYGAALVGGPIGGVTGAMSRGQAQDQLLAKQAADEDAKRQAIADRGPRMPEAPPGTQGELFTPEQLEGVERGKAAGVTPTEVPPQSARPAEVEPTGEQLGLGLEATREYADLVKERERLKRVPQTPEIKARIADLTAQLKGRSVYEVDKIRSQQDEDAAARKKFPGLAETAPIVPRGQTEMFTEEEAPVPQRAQEPAQEDIPEPTLREKGPKQLALPLRRNPEGQPTTFGQPEPTITAEEIMLTAIPLQAGPAAWVMKNVAGTTRSQLADLVKRQPDLIQGPGSRARLLRTLLATDVPAFEEAPRVRTPNRPKPPTQPVAEPGTSEPSVGVSGEPSAGPPANPPRAARPPRKPAPPVGGRLATPGQPAGQGTEPQGPQPGALTDTDAEEADRRAEAERMRVAMEAAAKPSRPAPQTAAEPRRAAPPARELPERLREPIGASDFGMEEGETDITRGPQGMLFPMTKAEEAAYGKKKQAERDAEINAEEETTPVPEKDERQGELDLREREEAPVKEIPTGVAVETTWSAQHLVPGQQVVYEDDEVALVRWLNKLDAPIYISLTRDGTQGTRAVTPTSAKPSWLTEAQIQRLRDAAVEAEQKETALAAANPDGPFAVGRNVVATDTVGKDIENYAAELLRSVGLGNLRVFIHGKPTKDEVDHVDRYKLYGAFSRPIKQIDASTNGTAGRFGKDENTYAIYLKPNMGESRTLEVLAHEIGHIVEDTAYADADDATRKAVVDEYLEWRKKAKLATKREFYHMLRNREGAADNIANAESSQTADKPATEIAQFDSYWSSFSEWFADNVSRWATTNEKPLSIAEKFFSNLAQKLRDLVAIVTGRKYPPAKTVADFMNKMGSPDLTPKAQTSRAPRAPFKEQFSLAPSTEALVDAMGPLDGPERSGLTNLINGFKQQSAEPNLGTKFRTQTADIAATIESRISQRFNGAVRDSLGKLNPMGLYRQAQDYTKMLLSYLQRGGFVKDPTTGLWVVSDVPGVRPPADIYKMIGDWGKRNGYSQEKATQYASRVLEAVRLDQLLKADPDFPSHMDPQTRAALVAEYNADPAFKAMNKLMDEARIAMVDNLVAVGRLSPEKGKEWKDVVGYVPFDRIDDFAEKFSKSKRTTGRSPLMLTKDPELRGSLSRPVGNVFDNYMNTLGWMVGQTINNDARTQTLRTLEDMGQAKFLHRSPQGKANTASAYVDGELNYWELPSKYDVLAFKDLNAPKAAWLQNLGAFSNVLRTTVTAMPPFALKQLTDDIQRAIVTSGVKSPGALLYMSLTNFPKLAFAAIRGIKHPIEKELGAMGIAGAYDFVQGKPAASLLTELGYKPRGFVKELLSRLNEFTQASDLAVRKAIYDQTLKEGGDQLLAQTRAREFINFRRRGASDFVGAMVTTIPFFNAYVQGMDVLYRAASGADSSSSVGRAEARKLFWNRAAVVTALSAMYALGKDEEDEEYNEADLRTRDSNWFIGGQKISVPGELGAIFKVIPERVVEYYKRQGTPEEQEAFEAMRTGMTYILEQYVGRMVPIPQAVKPLLEAFTNHSFLTGRELEGTHHKQMLPSQRRSAGTSELAIQLAEFSKNTVGVEVSPIMLDNALRGYFGSTAALVTATTDSLLNPTRVDRPLHKWALLSNYMIDPVGTRRITEFYEERERVGKLQTTLNDLAKTDMAAAEKFAAEHEQALALNPYINATLEQLEKTRAYRKFLNSPDGAQEMSKEDRARELEEVRKIEVDLTRWLREAKAEIRKQYPK